MRIRHLTVLVGVRGLEPPTSASRTLRASHLRYTPKLNLIVKELASAGIEPLSSARPYAGSISY